MTRLRELRKQAGYTQAELGRKVGVKSNTVTQWETGARIPRLDMLKKIAGVFGCSIDMLVDEDGGGETA